MSCTICPRTAADGLHACPRCTAELRAWLTELPAQATLLEHLIAPAARPAQGRPGSGRAHSPAPVDLRALALLGPGHTDPTGPDDDGTPPIAVLLGGWAGYIAYTYPSAHRDPHGTAHTRPCEAAQPRHGPTIGGWCAWLTAYLPYALTHPWISDLHHQLGTLVTRARAITHYNPTHHPHTAAPCPECDSYALVTVDGHTGLTCQDCGHHLTPQAHAAHRPAAGQTPEPERTPIP